STAGPSCSRHSWYYLSFGIWCLFLAGDDLVDEAEVQSLLGCHPVVPLRGRLDLPCRLAGVVRQDLIQVLLDPQEVLHVDLHVCHLALGTGGGLMDHDLRVGQSNALALGAGGQQKRAHAGGHADADGGYVALHVLHGVVDGHAVSDGAAGAVDIQLDVLVGVLGLQIQQLGNHKAGGGG
ncbi:O-acetyl-ADP-ribose deacetylase, partial [Dysosmobacter welbionis]